MTTPSRRDFFVSYNQADPQPGKAENGAEIPNHITDDAKQRGGTPARGYERKLRRTLGTHGLHPPPTRVAPVGRLVRKFAAREYVSPAPSPFGKIHPSWLRRLLQFPRE